MTTRDTHHAWLRDQWKAGNMCATQCGIAEAVIDLSVGGQAVSHFKLAEKLNPYENQGQAAYYIQLRTLRRNLEHLIETGILHECTTYHLGAVKDVSYRINTPEGWKPSGD